jgi:hypothetical protein
LTKSPESHCLLKYVTNSLRLRIPCHFDSILSLLVSKIFCDFE